MIIIVVEILLNNVMKLKIFYLLSIIFIFTACGTNTDVDDIYNGSNESFEMLEAVFDGPYKKQLIKERLDEMLTSYNMELKDDNYLKIGNQLVAIKKESKGKFREMDIINHMITASAEDGSSSFNQQLTKTVRELKQELAEK